MQRFCEVFELRCTPEQINHKGSPSRTKLDQINLIWSPHLFPEAHGPNTNHLPKHLANFWRGDKITFCSKHISIYVEPGLWVRKDFLHILSNRNRTSTKLDNAFEMFNEFRIRTGSMRMLRRIAKARAINGDGGSGVGILRACIVWHLFDDIPS
uniref:Uncharacterized protein n=1 Tax=Opuntia streptacantha TaxID=393608 RepID=A0A7C9AZ84_OPUST